MASGYLSNRVRSYSTGAVGRALNNVGLHHFVIDEPAYNGGPGEEISPADAFLAGVSACGVLLVERFAREANVVLQYAEASIEGKRKAQDPSRFDSVDITFRLTGPTQKEAEALVERYKGR